MTDEQPDLVATKFGSLEDALLDRYLALNIITNIMFFFTFRNP